MWQHNSVAVMAAMRHGGSLVHLNAMADECRWDMAFSLGVNRP